MVLLDFFSGGVMIDDLLRRIDSNAHTTITNIQRAYEPLARTVMVRWSDTVELIYDPSAVHTGFVLQIRALTERGWLEASFNPDGALSRGLIGDTLVIDGDWLIKHWQQAQRTAREYVDDAMA